MDARARRTAMLAILAGAALGSTAPAFAGNIREIALNRPYGTPTMVQGEFHIRASASDPVAVARGFLMEQRALTGIRNPAQELRVTRILGPDEVGMTHVRFQHTHRGVKVFGSDLVVGMKGNVVTSLSGVFLPSLNLPLNVRVQGDDASQLAMDHMRDLIRVGDINGDVQNRWSGLELDGNPELAYYNQGLVTDVKTATELAWMFTLSGYQYVVSARSGQVLDHWDTVREAMNRQVYDAKHTTSLPGTKVCSEGSGCTGNDVDANNAYDQFGLTYNYFKTVHNRDSWDDKGGVLTGTVHYSTNYQNAYWNGKQMVFGDDMVGLDVTAHELGHGVCQATCNLTYKSQSGALNESLSDVWGAMVDRGDWQIGEDIALGVIRDMSDPEAYGQPKDMDGYKNYIFYDNGGVHINSGIPNYACYLASDGGTNMGVRVTGVGRNVVEKVWYRTESKKLTSSSKFADFAKLGVQACGELYSPSGTECKEITNAFKAVGIM